MVSSDLYFLLMKPTSFWYQKQGSYFLTQYLLKFEGFRFVYTFFDNLLFTFLLLWNQVIAASQAYIRLLIAKSRRLPVFWWTWLFPFSLFVSPQQSHWGPSPFLRDVGQVSSLSATVRKGLVWVGDKEGTQAVGSPPSASRGRAAYPLGLDLSFSSFFPPPVTIDSPQDQDDKDHPRKCDTKSLTPKLGNATTTPVSPPRTGTPKTT